MTKKDEKPDVVLSDGREITFDLYAITRKEYSSLFDPGQTTEEESEILAKASNLKPEDIGDMNMMDWKKFSAAFFNIAARPVEQDSKN